MGRAYLLEDCNVMQFKAVYINVMLNLLNINAFNRRLIAASNCGCCRTSFT